MSVRTKKQQQLKVLRVSVSWLVEKNPPKIFFVLSRSYTKAAQETTPSQLKKFFKFFSHNRSLYAIYLLLIFKPNRTSGRPALKESSLETSVTKLTKCKIKNKQGRSPNPNSSKTVREIPRRQ